MKSPKISIITPVYNAEKFLHRCVDSIIAQTFKDWELILVDDGSTDSSGVICGQYSSRDSRIRVIHKNNAGVSAARQDGIDAALGEYTIHADSDDWIEPTMLEELYAKAKAEDADMVICDYYTNTDNNQALNIQRPTDVTDNDQIIRDLFQQLHGSCWNKLVRRSCYRDSNSYFPKEINFCEDVFFNVQLLLYSIKVCYLNKAFYHYYMNEESITHTLTSGNFEKKVLYENLMIALLEQHEKNDITNLFVETRMIAYLEAARYGLLPTKKLAAYMDRFLPKGKSSFKIRIFKTCVCFESKTKSSILYEFFLRLFFFLRRC